MPVGGRLDGAAAAAPPPAPVVLVILVGGAENVVATFAAGRKDWAARCRRRAKAARAAGVSRLPAAPEVDMVMVMMKGLWLDVYR